MDNPRTKSDNRKTKTILANFRPRACQRAGRRALARRRFRAAREHPDMTSRGSGSERGLPRYRTRVPRQEAGTPGYRRSPMMRYARKSLVVLMPANGRATYRIGYGAASPSFVDLPVIR
jgi:hypothetical protein